MTAPLCHHCQARPVARQFDTRVHKLPLRIVDGVRWRWFCSKLCAARHAALTSSGRRRAGWNEWCHQSRRNTIDRLIEACRPHLDERGRVDPKDLIGVVMRELRDARARAAELARRRLRSEAA
jgi:hypothetical protein